MDATLTEVINLGNKVQKIYSFEPPFSHLDLQIKSLLLNYDLESANVEIIDLETENILDTIDVKLYDEYYPDMILDKKVLLDFFKLKHIKMYKETDDYSDIL